MNEFGSDHAKTLGLHGFSPIAARFSLLEAHFCHRNCPRNDEVDFRFATSLADLTGGDRRERSRESARERSRVRLA